MLPARIVGALHDYDVALVERVDDADSEGEHDSLRVPPRIAIKASLPESWQWQTLWHELMHVIEEEQHLDLSEDQCERLALGFAALWRRNAWENPGERREATFYAINKCWDPNCWCNRPTKELACTSS